MTDPLPFHDEALFDEAGYARLYPGLAAAVMRGTLDSLWGHYDRHGRTEGRRPNDVDPAWYIAAYPEMEGDLGHPPGHEDAARHYFTFGQARGWLPHASAPRLANAAAAFSPYGTLWTDQANAPDLLAGRRSLGRIGTADAAWLRRFILEGFAETPAPADPAQTAAAGRAVDAAFTGARADLRFDCPSLDTHPIPWREEIRGQPASVLDPHMVFAALRDLVCDPALGAALALIFDAKPKLVATEATPGRARLPTRDAARIPLTLPLGGVAVRVCLEDPGESAAVVWPASHRLPDLPFADGSLAAPLGCPDDAWRVRLYALLRDRSALVLPPLALPATAGARVIRHLGLAHAETETPGRRLMLTAWYCPEHVAPCYQETTAVLWHEHRGMAFSSGVYPAMAPEGGN